MSNYAPIEKRYSVDEFLEYVETETQKPGCENNRYELINGIIYMMADPSVTHYNVCKYIERKFDNYFEGKECTIFNGSVSLFLFDARHITLFTSPEMEHDHSLTPDLMVICNKRTIVNNDGVHGIPDLIVEVVSKSNAGNDYIRKLNAYFTFRIKEYWIVDPIKRKIKIYDMITDPDNPIDHDYTFDHIVRSELFEDLYIDFKQFTGFVEK